MTDKLTAAIKEALRSVLQVRPEDRESVQYWRTDKRHLELTTLDHIAAVVADVIRAAGETRTEYEVTDGDDLDYRADSLKFAIEDAEEVIREGGTATVASREVLTLTGDWEPVELPTTEGRTDA